MTVAAADWAHYTGFLRSRPPPDGLARMADAVVAGGRVLRSRRLAGGLGAAAAAVDIGSPDGAVVRVVLKRMLPGGRSGRAVAEHERLRVVHQRAAMPTPSPLAVDEAGRWFGQPALVMTRLPGRSTLAFRAGDWPEQVGAAIAPLHRASVTDLPALVTPRSPDVPMPMDPKLARGPWPDVSAAITERLPGLLSRPLSLVHGDYHPGQVLWQGARLSGVIDWADLRLSRPLEDVGCARVDTLIIAGLRHADRLAAGYAAAADIDDGELAVWDLLAAARARRFVANWITSFQESGRPDLSASGAYRRLSAFAAARLAVAGAAA